EGGSVPTNGPAHEHQHGKDSAANQDPPHQHRPNQDPPNQHAPGRPSATEPSQPTHSATESTAIATEQRALDERYARVDALREEVAEKLRRTLRAPAGDSTALLDRDTQVMRLEERAAD